MELWKHLRMAQNLPALLQLHELTYHGIDPITLKDTFGVSDTIAQMLNDDEAEAIRKINNDHSNTLNFHIYSKLWNYLDKNHVHNQKFQYLKRNLLYTHSIIISEIARLHVSQCEIVDSEMLTFMKFKNSDLYHRIHGMSKVGLCPYCLRQAMICKYHLNFSIMLLKQCHHDHIQPYKGSELWGQFDITTFFGFGTCPMHEQKNITDAIDHHLFYFRPSTRLELCVSCVDYMLRYLVANRNFTKIIQIVKSFFSKTIFSNKYKTVIKFCRNYSTGIKIIGILHTYRECLLSLNLCNLSQELSVQFNKFLTTYVNKINNNNRPNITLALIENIDDCRTWRTTKVLVDRAAKSTKIVQAPSDPKFLRRVWVDDIGPDQDITSFLILMHKLKMKTYCIDSFVQLYKIICDKVNRFTGISGNEITNCVMAAHISWTIKEKHNFEFVSASDIFNNTFQSISRWLNCSHSKSNCNHISCPSLIWDEKANSTIFNALFCYLI